MLDQLKKYIEEGKLAEIKDILLKDRNILTVKDDYGDLLMHYAAKNCPRDHEYILDIIAEFLPDDAEDLNIIGSGGNTIYHIAVKRDIRILIDSIVVNGSDKSIKNNDGKTPLECIDPRTKYNYPNKFFSCIKPRKNKFIANEQSFVDMIKNQRDKSLEPGCSIN